jgi:hypothetical protein
MQRPKHSTICRLSRSGQTVMRVVHGLTHSHTQALLARIRELERRQQHMEPMMAVWTCACLNGVRTYMDSFLM